MIVIYEKKKETLILITNGLQILQLQSGNYLNYAGRDTLPIRNVVIMYGNTKDEVIEKAIAIGVELDEATLSHIELFLAGMRTDAMIGFPIDHPGDGRT